MMKYLIAAMAVLSLIYALLSGNVGELSNSIISSSGEAVNLAISLVGIMCLWSGVMRVAQKSGITTMLAALFKPILTRLFNGLDRKGKAAQYIVLNLTANLLGLGNASTPFGLAAIKELSIEEKADSVATDNMILFVVMNTASLQLIPATVAALRLKNGSSEPMSILPAVWIVSVLNFAVVVTAAKLLKRIWRKKGGRK